MPYSDAQKRATIKYKTNNYERLVMDVKKGMKDIYKNQAEKKGMSLAGYIQYLIEKDMEENKNDS